MFLTSDSNLYKDTGLYIYMYIYIIVILWCDNLHSPVINSLNGFR